MGTLPPTRPGYYDKCGGTKIALVFFTPPLAVIPLSPPFLVPLVSNAVTARGCPSGTKGGVTPLQPHPGPDVLPHHQPQVWTFDMDLRFFQGAWPTQHCACRFCCWYRTVLLSAGITPRLRNGSTRVS